MEREPVIHGEAFHPILPRDIDITDEFRGLFGKNEREQMARAIIHYCQQQNQWQIFTPQFVQAIYVQQHPHLTSANATGAWNEMLNPNFMDPRVNTEWIGYVQLIDPDHQFFGITGQFIDRCFAKAPAKQGLGKCIEFAGKYDLGISFTDTMTDMADLGRKLYYLALALEAKPSSEPHKSRALKEYARELVRQSLKTKEVMSIYPT